MFSIKIEDRVAWVTGGSRGIGRATATAMATAGCKVAVGYRSGEAEATAVVKEIQDAGGQAMAVQVDVADAASVDDAYRKIKENLGPVGILVNSAGIIKDNLFMGLEEDDWQDVLNVNLMGSVHTCKAVTRDMMGQRWGRIINMSSVAGQKSGKGQANYAASKGAVEAMSRSLACELGRRNITVNCLAPGVIETDMSAEVRKLGHDEILARQIIKRFGQPDEIAAWAVFLASDAGGFVTGQTFGIDGGIKMV